AGFRLAGGTDVRVPASLLEGRESTATALGVRPEKIRMIEPAKDVPAGLNKVPGTVTHASYLGVSTQYIVTLADGHRVTVFEQNVERATKAELWNAGEQVVLAWAPEHCFVVDDPTGKAGEIQESAHVTLPLAACPRRRFRCLTRLTFRSRSPAADSSPAVPWRAS